MGTTNFANIIFTSNNNLETSYVYQFNTSSSPNNNWVPISTLTNVIIIANTEINIQLTIPSTITGNYYVFIKSTITNTIIWQQSDLNMIRYGAKNFSDINFRNNIFPFCPNS